MKDVITTIAPVIAITARQQCHKWAISLMILMLTLLILWTVRAQSATTPGFCVTSYPLPIPGAANSSFVRPLPPKAIVFRNGLLQVAPGDYTVSGANFILTKWAAGERVDVVTYCP